MSGDAPRQYIHPEKRAALEAKGWTVDSIVQHGSNTWKLKWRLPSGQLKVFSSVTKALKVALGERSVAFKRIMKMTRTTPTTFKKGENKKPLTPEAVALLQAGWEMQEKGARKDRHTTWLSPQGHPTGKTGRAYKKMLKGVEH